MERLFFAKIELWLVALVGLVGFLVFIGLGAAALNDAEGGRRFGWIGRAAHELFGTVDTVEQLIKQPAVMQAAMDAPEDPAGWSFPAGKTASGLPGYWLMSRHVPAEQRTVIELVRLSDNQVVQSWFPTRDGLYSGVQNPEFLAKPENWTDARMRVFHPYLLENGDLIVKDSHTPLSRIDHCGKRLWLQDQTLLHHSTESDGEGGFWIPSVISPSAVPFVPEGFEDDGLAHVTADGKLPQNLSLTEILMRHGMQAIVFPPFAKALDPIHLNDIQPVLADGPYWKRGDLFLSLRHPSMIMLYRPATDEIIWQRSGLWMAQHDVDILDDHRISIFDNQSYYRGSFGRVDGTSDIAIYDFATDQVSHPQTAVLEREQVVALYEGLVDQLPGGAFVIEDHNTARILLFAADGSKLGQFVNKAHDADKRGTQIGWGRYVDQALGDQVVKAVAASPCAG